MQMQRKYSRSSVQFKFRVFNSHTFVSTHNFDIENGAIFVPQNLLLQSGFCEQDWVSICISGSESHSRLVKVSSLNEESDGRVFMSPLLWFNLNSDADNFIPRNENNVQIVISAVKDIPTFAKAVHVSLVQSPNYSANSDYSTLIRNYFSIQRVVKKGDVIAIDSKSDLLYCTKLKDELRDVWPVIFFKVVQIEGSGSLVDVNNSKLYQTGTTKCFVPSLMKDYYDESELKIGFLRRQLEKLTEVCTPYFLVLKSVAVILLSGTSGSGKSYVVRSLSKVLNIHLLEVDFNRILCDTPSATEAKVKIMFDKISRYMPCVVLFSNLEIMCGESNGNDSRVADCFQRKIEELKAELPTLLIVESNDPEVILNSDYGTLFRHHVTIDALEEDERLYTLKLLLTNRYLSNDVDLSGFTKKLSGFVFDDLQVFVKKAISNAYQRISGFLEEPTNSGDSNLELTENEVYLIQSDFELALKDMQKAFKESIGAPTVPNVDWTDIGGLEEAKKEILETIQLPLEHKELTDCGLRRSGILLHGPPGTGKTLLAKAVASQCGINFLSVKGPEIINMYVGQSEENVRNVFRTARNSAPCVVFFDEFDSIAPNRGRSGDSGGVMDRVVSQLLAEIDGIHKHNQVFVIGATNRPDLLDPALLRPGRFDRQVYVGIAEDSESRLKILRALTRNFKFEDNFDLKQVEAQCPRLLTGADFYNLCSSSMMLAIERCISQKETDCLEEENFEIQVQLNDFLESLRTLKPSVSEIDLIKYKHSRQ